MMNAKMMVSLDFPVLKPQLLPPPHEAGKRAAITITGKGRCGID